MKKVFKLLLTLLCFLPFMVNVKAVCEDRELNDFVEKLEIKFLAPSKVEDYSKEYLEKHSRDADIEYAYFFYLSESKYKDKGIEEILELEAYDGSDVKGVWKYHESIDKYAVGGYNGVQEEEYKLKIKAVSGSCKGEILKETTYTVPQFNMYRQTRYCEKYPDHELCARFTNATKDMNDLQFGQAMAKYEKSLNKQNAKFLDLFLKYYGYVLCAILPAIIVSIYYRRRIRRFIKMRNRDEDNHIKRRKVGLFILLFLLLITNVKAQSTECPIKVERKRAIVTIPGTEVSINHCGWGEPGWRDYSGTFDNIGNWGTVPYDAWVSGCGINGYMGHNLHRCLTKDETTIVNTDNPAYDHGAGVYLQRDDAIRTWSGGDGKVLAAPGTASAPCMATAKACDCAKYAEPTEVRNSSGVLLYMLPGGCIEWKYSCGPVVGCGDASPGQTCRGQGTMSFPVGDGTFDGVDAARTAYTTACNKAKSDPDKICKSSGWDISTGGASCSEGASTLRCPSYPCNATSTSVNPTIETYTIDTVDAYCVNPGASAGSSYTAVDIDVNKCAASNSSVDCGYANILVEALYHNTFTVKEDSTQSKIPDTVVALATRLWGAYTNQGGYNTIGLGTYTGVNCKVDLTGNVESGGPSASTAFQTCNEMIYLDSGDNPNPEALNVYRKTIEKMLNLSNVTDLDLDKYENLGDVEIKDAAKTFKGLKCEKNSADGVICGENTKEMEYTLALFFNTRNGNKHLKEHLNRLYGGLSVIPVDIKISSQSTMTKADVDFPETVEEDCVRDADGNCKISKTILNIDYSEEITQESERVDCSKLDQLVSNHTLTQEQADSIRNYCNVQVNEIRAYHAGGYTEYTENGYRECRETGEVDANGDIIYKCDESITPVSGTIGKISACQKSTCVLQTKIYADCSMGITKIEARIKYKGSKSVKGIRKYVACNTANPTNDINNQFLVKIDEYDRVEDVDVPDDVETVLEATVNCAAPCQDVGPKFTRKTCSEPTYSDITSNKYESATGVKSYETSIHDPSLSCILNASPMNKTTYDFSDYFGVNTDLCRIYCSDSVHYYLPDKTLTYAGLSLKYDIEFGTSLHNDEYGKYNYSDEYKTKYYGKNKAVQSLTSIIEMRRDCVSEIYFNDLTNGKTFEEIAGRYGFLNASDRETYGDLNTFVRMYNATLHKSKSRENSRNEQLTRLIYDLYNCNLYSEIPMTKPKDNTTGPIYENVIKKIYYDNFGFEDCELNSETNTCINYDGMTFEGGAKYATNSKAYRSNVFEVGDDLDTTIYKYTLDLNPENPDKDLPNDHPRKSLYSKNPRVPEVTNVLYCSGEDCFEYTNHHKDTDTYKIRDNEYQSDTPDITQGAYLLPYKRISNYNGESKTMKVSYINNTKNTVEQEVPTNDYAYFSISTKVGFYNVSEFQAEEYTGNVYDVTTEKNYKGIDAAYKEAKNDNRTNIAQGLYPIAVSPIEECGGKDHKPINGSKTNESYFSCQTQTYIGETNTYFRNYGKGTNNKNKLLDKFYAAINNRDNTTYVCYYVSKYAFDGDPQVIYRNVELTDFFPINRSVGKNWSTKAAEKYVNQTEKYVEENGTLQYYDKHLEYSYTLTQSTLRKIREYNEKTKKYTNPYTSKPQYSVSSNKYKEIKSQFLENIDTEEQEVGQLGIINNMRNMNTGYGYVRGVSVYTHEVRDRQEREKQN